MFGVLIYDFLFFAIPLLLFVLWGISLYRYCSAKKQNRKRSGAFSPGEIRKRAIVFVVLSVIISILIAVVIGFMVLLFMAVAYM